jgi:hypothetical protein
VTLLRSVRALVVKKLKTAVGKLGIAGVHSTARIKRRVMR